MTPAVLGSRHGNRITALRIAMQLRGLFMQPFVCSSWPLPATKRDLQRATVMIAIHARRSAASIARYASTEPRGKIVLVLGGTELYPHFDDAPETLASLLTADRIVGLQPLAIAALPAEFRGKVRTIEQSAQRTVPLRAALPPLCCHAVIAAHLRPIKQPTLPAEALQLLPDLPNLRVDLLGDVIDPVTGTEVAAAALRDPRFRWLGERPRRETQARIAAADLLLLPSLGEGGASVISEAIVHGTPVLASAIPGNVGLLGADWPGLFDPKQPAQLALLLRRAATDAAFVTTLRLRTAQLAKRFTPAYEQRLWSELLAELARS